MYFPIFTVTGLVPYNIFQTNWACSYSALCLSLPYPLCYNRVPNPVLWGPWSSGFNVLPGRRPSCLPGRPESPAGLQQDWIEAPCFARTTSFHLHRPSASRAQLKTVSAWNKADGGVSFVRLYAGLFRSADNLRASGFHRVDLGVSRSECFGSWNNIQQDEFVWISEKKTREGKWNRPQLFKQFNPTAFGGESFRWKVTFLFCLRITINNFETTFSRQQWLNQNFTTRTLALT